MLDNISADQITSVTKQKNKHKPFVLILFFILNLAVAKNLHVCQVTDVGLGGHLHQACGWRCFYFSAWVCRGYPALASSSAFSLQKGRTNTIRIKLVSSSVFMANWRGNYYHFVLPGNFLEASFWLNRASRPNDYPSAPSSPSANHICEYQTGCIGPWVQFSEK